MSKTGVDSPREPFSPSREEEIRSAVRTTLQRGTSPEENLFDVRVVAELLGEVDRLRGKLQQAALARDLTGRAASTLRDACDDVAPRPTRFRKAAKDPTP